MHNSQNSPPTRTRLAPRSKLHEQYLVQLLVRSINTEMVITVSYCESNEREINGAY
jgi:hypothetical protein